LDPVRTGALGLWIAMLACSDREATAPMQRMRDPVVEQPAEMPVAEQWSVEDAAEAVIFAEEGKLDQLKAKLDRGVPIDSLGPLEEPLVVRASRFGRTEVIDLLLSRGADVDRGGRDRRGPLSCAAEEGHAASVKLLLDRGASIDAQDRFGNTALLLAVTRDRIEVVKLLLERHASAKISAQQTVATAAVYTADPALVKAVLDAGADPNKRNAPGSPPLHVAVEQLAILGAYDPVETKAIEDKQIAVMKLLVDHGARTSERDARGRTPLVMAKEKFLAARAAAHPDRAQREQQILSLLEKRRGK
jgi:ankyrin repeat protein